MPDGVAPSADRARARRRGDPVGADRPPRRRDHERPRGPRVRGRDRVGHAGAQPARRGDRSRSSRTSTSCATRRAAGCPPRSTRSPRRRGVGMVLDEPALPIPGPVRAACEFLGLDPLHVANEGKLVAIVPARRPRTRCWPRCARSPRAPRRSSSATVIADHPGMVTIRTIVGSRADRGHAGRGAAAPDLLRPDPAAELGGRRRRPTPTAYRGPRVGGQPALSRRRRPPAGRDPGSTPRRGRGRSRSRSGRRTRPSR